MGQQTVSHHHLHPRADPVGVEERSTRDEEQGAQQEEVVGEGERLVGEVVTRHPHTETAEQGLEHADEEALHESLEADVADGDADEDMRGEVEDGPGDVGSQGEGALGDGSAAARSEVDEAGMEGG
jgi:hypothetical protein